MESSIDPSERQFENAVSCAAATLCAMVDENGHVLVGQSNPTLSPPPTGGGTGSSAGSTTAAAVTAATTTPSSSTVPAPPTPAQIQAALAAVLEPSGQAAQIKALLKKGSYATSFAALESGRLAISWYYLPKAHTSPRRANRSPCWSRPPRQVPRAPARSRLCSS